MNAPWDTATILIGGLSFIVGATVMATLVGGFVAFLIYYSEIVR